MGHAHSKKQARGDAPRMWTPPGSQRSSPRGSPRENGHSHPDLSSLSSALGALKLAAKPGKRPNDDLLSEDETVSETETRDDVDDDDEFEDDSSSLVIPFEQLSDMQLLGTGPHGSVYKAHYQDRPVAVKMIDPKIVSVPEGAAAAATRYNLFKSQAGVILLVPPHEAICYIEGICPGALALVGELMDSNLEDLLFKRKNGAPILEWPERLRLCLDVASGLKHLHVNNVVHGDLNGRNVFVEVTDDGSVGRAKLSDFGMFPLFARKQAPAVLGIYASPELTLRGVIDRPGDVFALSMLMFQLLCLNVPYAGFENRSEIPSKVANDPSFRPSLDDLPQEPNATYSRTRTQFVELMNACWHNSPSKRPTAGDIVVHLNDMLEQITNPAYVSKFQNGQFTEKLDVPSPVGANRATFMIPATLFGRDADMQIACNIFAFTDRHTCRCLLVSGPSGVGKSVFVRQVFHQLTASANQEMYSFFTGKYNLSSNHVPYSAIVSAFGAVIDARIISPSMLNAKTLKSWKSRLTKALGRNGQLIVDVLPQIGEIIGKQRPIIELPPDQAQRRFLETFARFVEAITSSQYKLTLFLDDLQWADRGSFKLLEQLIRNPNLFLVGTYRDNEVHESHPLLRTIETLRRITVVHHISLTPLPIEDLNAMVAETLHVTDPDATMPLTELINSKTNGNPFFFLQFFSMLYHQEHVIVFDPKRGQFTWDIEAVRKICTSASEDVVGLMLNKLKRLPPKSQGILKLASCLGDTFEFYVLAAICENVHLEDGSRVGNIRSDNRPLLECLRGGYIQIKNTNSSPTALSQENSGSSAAPAATASKTHRLFSSATCRDDVLYAFAHDRVQQASQSLWKNWTETNGPRVRLEIGRTLLKIKHLEADPNSIFDIAANLNLGAQLIRDSSELLRLVELNLKAAQQALKATDYAKSLSFVRNGMDILFKLVPALSPVEFANKSVWDHESCHALCVKMSLMAERLEYFNKHDAEGDVHFREICAHAKSPVHIGEAYSLKAKQLLIEGRYAECLVILPQFFSKEQAEHYAYHNITDDQMFSLVASIRKVLAAKDYEQISKAALTDDPNLYPPELTILVDISMSLGFLGNQTQQIYLVGRILEICLNSSGYCLPYVAMNAYLRFAYNLVVKSPTPETFVFARRIAETVASHPDFKRLPEAVFTYIAFAKMWSHPIKDTIRQLRKESVPLSLENGNRVYAGMALTWFAPLNMYLSGKAIGSVLQEFDELSTFCDANNIQLGICALKATRVVSLLLDESREQEIVALEKEIFRFPTSIQRSQYLSLRALTMFLLERYESAIEACVKSYGHTRATTADIAAQSLIWTLEVIPRCRLIKQYKKQRPEPSQKDMFFFETCGRVIQDRIEKLRIFTDCAYAENFGHYYHLAIAENARMSHSLSADDIIRNYKEAVERARRNDFLVFEAIASEALSTFYEEMAMDAFSREYLLQALRRFEQWGAVEKVKLLRERSAALSLSTPSVTTSPSSPSFPDSPTDFQKPRSSTCSSSSVNIYETMQAALIGANENESFKRHLERQFAGDMNVENFYFLLRAHEYRKESDVQRRSKILMDIWTLYLREESSMCLNIGAPQRRAIQKIVQSVSASSSSSAASATDGVRTEELLNDNLLNDIESTSLLNLTDSFKTFMETRHYKRWVAGSSRAASSKQKSRNSHPKGS